MEFVAAGQPGRGRHELQWIDDLRAGIAAGRHPWLHEEFTTALRAGTFTNESWHTAYAAPALALDKGAGMPDQQRHVWQALFPDEPFPRADA